MGDLTENINQNNSILVSRNTPVGLVVGAAGFIGSNLVESLLKKGSIQVIGVDDFSTGKKDYIAQAVKDKNFHFVNDSAAHLTLDISRLDYIFIVTDKSFKLDNLLQLAKQYNSKLLIVSTIELYNNKTAENLRWLKEAESNLAKFASDHNLNARVVRLSAVYGPRMHFNYSDPIVSLIQATLAQDLQNESTSLDFSTRAIFISDAVDLIIKSMLSGSTALKIFDGALPSPIKVADIKQVLMDPIWHEQRGFTPIDLPPWLTPNLEKTIEHLSWKPKTSLVQGLKETIAYFKDYEIEIPKAKPVEVIRGQVTGKQKVLWDLKQEGEKKRVKYFDLKLPQLHLHLSKVYLAAVLLLFCYALVLPVAGIFWGVFDFRSKLQSSENYLVKGDFDTSLKSLAVAQNRVNEAESLVKSLSFLKEAGIFNQFLEKIEDLISVTELTTKSLEHTVLGTRYIYQSLKAVTGELNFSPKELLESAQVEFASADQDSAIVSALITKEGFKKNLPQILGKQLSRIEEKLDISRDLIKKGRAAAEVLPYVVAVDGKKSYLVLLQNNAELRPGGGFIGSYAQIDFEGGRLKDLKVNDIYSIDGALKIHVEPPREIREDMGQTEWFLRDSNWESDFPTSARQAAWFYNQQAGVRVDGVMALDVSAIANLLDVVGEIDLADYNEKINSGNLFEKAVTHAEEGFFPGSQAKKNFITALTASLFNKLFFLPHQNWSAIVTSLGRSLEEKHLMVYLDDTQMFSYLVAQNWAGVMPRQTDNTEGEVRDFLSVVEANMGGNKANYYLDRNYHLETTIGKDGEVLHRLKINYTNRSPSNAFPAGKYKNRFRIYLPFGTKLERALWGEKDITNSSSVFTDFGRTGYSLLLELQSKEAKSLILDYKLSAKISFKDAKAVYKLDILKQPGVDKDPLDWTLTYPISYKIKSEEGQGLGPQEHIVSTDLSKDRSLQVEFIR